MKEKAGYLFWPVYISRRWRLINVFTRPLQVISLLGSVLGKVNGAIHLIVIFSQISQTCSVTGKTHVKVHCYQVKATFHLQRFLHSWCHYFLCLSVVDDKITILVDIAIHISYDNITLYSLYSHNLPLQYPKCVDSMYTLNDITDLIYIDVVCMLKINHL